MRAVVIGANGYFGINLVAQLKNRGVFVTGCGTGVDNGSNANNYLNVDITDQKSVSQIDFSCDAVYMLSGKSGTTQGFDYYQDFITINEIGLLNILNEYVKQKSNALLVFPSSRLVYDGNSEPIKESGSINPKTIYAANKVACEHYIKMYSSRFGLRYCIFRIGLPYGGMVTNKMPNVTIGFMIESAIKQGKIQLFGGGKQKRTFTHIQYICDIFIDSISNKDMENDIFNIGGESYSLFDIAQMISRKIPSTIVDVPWPKEYELIETGDSVLDSGKLNSITNSVYRYFIEEWVDDQLIKTNTTI